MIKKIYPVFVAAVFGFGLQSSALAQTCTAVDAITTSTLSLTNQSKVCETTAALKFTCNKTNGSRQFNYGKTTSYGTNGGNVVGSRTPSINLTGLESGIKYYFKIVGIYEGITEYTMTGSFTTNKPAAVNNVPQLTALPDSLVVKVDSTTTFTVKATDADKDPLQFTYPGLPSWATTKDSVVTFKPVSGSQSFIFKVSVADGKGGTAQDSMKVSVAVPAVNKTPVLTALPDSFKVTVGQTATFTVHATDADKDPLQFSYPGLPSWVTTKDSVATFKPVSGSQSFMFKVSIADGKGGTVQDSMKVSIAATVGARQVTMNSAAPNTIVTIGKNAIAIPSGSDKTLSVQLFSINGTLVLKHDVNVVNQVGTVPAGLFRGNGTYLCKITGATTSQKQVVTILK